MRQLQKVAGSVYGVAITLSSILVSPYRRGGKLYSSSIRGYKKFCTPGEIGYICSMENNNTPYSSRDAVIDLYMHNDLPEDELAFQYIVPGGKTAWIHKDELRREAALRTSYPQANTQKGKK